MVMAALVAFGTATAANAAPPQTMAWPDTPPPAAPAPAPRITAPLMTEKEAIRDVLRRDPDIGARYRQGRGMVVGGAVSLGVAGGSLLTAGLFALIADFSEHSDPDDDVDDYDASDERSVAVGFAVTAGVLVAVGIPLVVVGARRRADAIHDARRRVSLGMGPRGFGLRF
jgi:hypothetical protein